MVAAGGCPPARIPEAPAPTRHQGRRHPARGRGLGNTATRSSRPGSLTANASFSYTRAAPGCPSRTRPTTASSFAGRRAAPSRPWTTTCAPSRSARVGGPERYRPGRAHRDRRAVHAGGDVAYYNGTAWVRLGAGSAGQFLQTGEASANPSWRAPPAPGRSTAAPPGSSRFSAGAGTAV